MARQSLVPNPLGHPAQRGDEIGVSEVTSRTSASQRSFWLRRNACQHTTFESTTSDLPDVGRTLARL